MLAMFVKINDSSQVVNVEMIGHKDRDVGDATDKLGTECWQENKLFNGSRPWLLTPATAFIVMISEILNLTNSDR